MTFKIKIVSPDEMKSIMKSDGPSATEPESAPATDEGTTPADTTEPESAPATDEGTTPADTTEPESAPATDEGTTPADTTEPESAPATDEGTTPADTTEPESAPATDEGTTPADTTEPESAPATDEGTTPADTTEPDSAPATDEGTTPADNTPTDSASEVVPVPAQDNVIDEIKNFIDSLKHKIEFLFAELHKITDNQHQHDMKLQTLQQTVLQQPPVSDKPKMENASQKSATASEAEHYDDVPATTAPKRKVRKTKN
jgi:hypothetical protein